MKVVEPALKFGHSKGEDSNMEKHSCSSKSSQEKYDSYYELESGLDNRSKNLQYVRRSRVRDPKRDKKSLVDYHDKTKRHRHKDLQVIHLVDDRFSEALEYRTHCLADKPSHPDKEVAKNVAK